MIPKVEDPEFIAQVEKGIPLERLIRRLWPALSEDGEWNEWTRKFTKEEWDELKDVFSGVGFLGRDENLLEVVHSDWETVKKYGTAHQEIGEALQQLIELKYQPHPEYEFIDEKTRNEIFDRHIVSWSAYQHGGWQGCPWGCGRFNGDAGVIVRKDASEDEKIEALYANTGGIENTSYRWVINELAKNPDWRQMVQQMHRIKSNYSRRNGRGLFYTHLTGVLPHLITEHYFFEGKHSPYRGDPTFLIQALNLEGVKS